MKRYTLSSLINRLAQFEERIAEIYMAQGDVEKAEKARRNAREILELKDFIIVEMTLEPINTVDPIELLADNPDPEAVRRDVYSRVARDVEHVSGELADLLRNLST